MNAYMFMLSLFIGVVGPAIAIRYLRPILTKVLQGLCDAEGGAEFWIRCAYLLAICGTLLLILTFGEFTSGADPVSSLRRSLLLVFAGVFLTVGIISRNVWTQVRQWLLRDIAMPASAAGTLPAGENSGPVPGV